MNKILYIEDELELIGIMKARLKSWGFEMVFALDGVEGLKKAADEQPNLILLDIIMPKMDGLACCRELRASPIFKHIPIIIVSASSETDLRERCLTAGANDIAIKPYEPQDLLQKINTHLKL